MALFGYEKSTLKRNIVIGIGGAIVLYLVFRQALKGVFVKKGIDISPNKNFVGADGYSSDGEFTAKRYDANYINPDGTLGATWIAYNDSDIVGYWKAGVVKLGSTLSQLI